MLLRQALVAHAAYTDALSSFPALPRSFTRAEAQAAIDRALEVQIAYTALAAAEPTLSGISLNSADHVRLLDLVPAPASTPPAETTEPTAFVARVESVLAESAAGRHELGARSPPDSTARSPPTGHEPAPAGRRKLPAAARPARRRLQTPKPGAAQPQASCRWRCNTRSRPTSTTATASSPPDRGNTRCRRMRASRSPASWTCSRARPSSASSPSTTRWQEASEAGSGQPARFEPASLPDVVAALCAVFACTTAQSSWHSVRRRRLRRARRRSRRLP